MKLRIGELGGRAVFGFPKDCRLVGVFFEVAVDAVVGNIQLPADEPFRVGWLPVEDLFGLLEPMK